MTIFLYGQDTYRSRKKLNEIIEHYKKIHQSGLNLKYFDGKELNFEDFRDETQQASMFDEKKLAILINVFSDQKFKEKFLKNNKIFINSENTIIFYEEKEITKNDKFLNFLEKHGKIQNFELLEEKGLRNWLKKEFVSYKTDISSRAVDKLINFVGNDLWQLSNEIKKLVNFKSGKKIESEDIELLVRPKIETDIFKTIDAIALKNKKSALSLIHKHLEKGDSPLYLLSMINFQFRNLLIIKDLLEKNKPYYSILKTSKLHPFIVKKSLEQANKFTLPELKKIYQKIFQVDLAIKTGKVEPKTALDLLLIEI